MIPRPGGTTDTTKSKRDEVVADCKEIRVFLAHEHFAFRAGDDARRSGKLLRPDNQRTGQEWFDRIRRDRRDGVAAQAFVADLRRQAQELKEGVAEQELELRLLKKSMIGDGGDEA